MIDYGNRLRQSATYRVTKFITPGRQYLTDMDLMKAMAAENDEYENATAEL